MFTKNLDTLGSGDGAFAGLKFCIGENAEMQRPREINPDDFVCTRVLEQLAATRDVELVHATLSSSA